MDSSGIALRDNVLTIMDNLKEHMTSQQYLDVMNFWSLASQPSVRVKPNGIDYHNADYNVSLLIRNYTHDEQGTVTMKVETEIAEYHFIDGLLDRIEMSPSTDPHMGVALMIPRMILSFNG